MKRCRLVVAIGLLLSAETFGRDVLASLDGVSGVKSTPLTVARAEKYKTGFVADGDVIRAATGTSTAAGAGWSVRLDQKTTMPVKVFAEGRLVAGSGEVLIYVDVSYADGGHLWGQKARFSTKKTDTWQTRCVTVLPERPIRTLSIYVMARGGEGLEAHFRNVRLDETNVAEGVVTFDGVPVVAKAQLTEPTFLVRDVAAKGDGFARIGADAKDLRLKASCRTQGAARFYDVTLEDERGGDRAVTLAWAQPIDTKDGRWFDSPRTERPFAGATGEFRRLQPSACGAGGFSRLPFVAVTDGGRGLAIGVDPRLPGYFRVGASPDLKLAYLTYDFALVPEKRTAHVGFVTFPFEAKDGWRGALEAYQKLFPEFNVVHQKRQGIWMAFRQISKVEGWEDFGFAIKEGDNEIAWDDAHGITTYRYTEPTTWWMKIDGKDGRKQATMDECVARAEALAAPDCKDKSRGYAQAWKRCAMKDESGAYYGRILDTPWCNGIVWNLNCAPGLGPDCEFAAKLGEPAFSKRYAGTFPQGLDGEYVDSSEMYVTADLDFNRANFAGMATPLTFASESLRPGVFKGMMGYEYVRGIYEKVRAIGRRTMANATPLNWCWLAPYLDVMGTETNWHPKDRWSPSEDNRLIVTRALCGAKPFCFLQNTDFNTFTYEMCEKYMQRSLAYGFYPSFFSPAASSSSHYFTKPAYYNRDRPLFKKYIPLCRLVGEAGWRPVNRLATSDNAQVFVEQFGDGYVTVFNSSGKPQTAKIRALRGGPADELVAGGTWAFADGVETVTLPPETVRVLRFAGDRFLSEGQTVVLEASEGEDAASLSARILAYDDRKRFPRLKRIVLFGKDKASSVVQAYAAQEKWPAFKNRYAHLRIDYALVGPDVEDMVLPLRQKKENRSHVFSRKSLDDRMKLFVEGSPYDSANPVCRFWEGPDMTPAEVVDAVPVPAWVDREIDATKARIEAWKGNDEIVLVPTLTDFHFYSPVCGVWPNLKAVTSSMLAHAKYLKRVIERLGADAGANLGDLGFDFCPRHWSQSLDYERAARLAVEDAIYASLKVPFVMVPGNHDGGWDSPTGFGDRFNAPEFPRTRSFKRGPTGAYGYLDLPAKRTRLFFISTSESGNGGGKKITDEQVAFMRRAVAETPDGWTAMFFSHDCLHEDCGRWNYPDYKTPEFKKSSGYVGLRTLLSETILAGRVKARGILCGDSHFDLDWTDPATSIRYVISQGYGGCGKALHPKTPAVATELHFKRSEQMLVDVSAMKPATGEWRIFRVGVGGASRDR